MVTLQVPETPKQFAEPHIIFQNSNTGNKLSATVANIELSTFSNIEFLKIELTALQFLTLN